MGLDVGTTGCKAHVFDVGGSLLLSAQREYRVQIPQPDWAEQNIENVWMVIQEMLQETTSRLDNSQEVHALSLSVHGEAVTPVDKESKPLRALILGMDTRTEDQNEWIRDNFGAKEIFEITGMPVHTINTLPKLLWIKQSEPEIWEQADKFLLVEDYLIQKLTGQSVISACLASRTQLYDIAKGDWSDEILQTIGLDRNRLSEIVPSGAVVGQVLPEVADELGFRKSPIVVTGGHDQACGALGAGLTKPGLAMVSTGTAEVVEVVLTEFSVNDVLFDGNISVYKHVVPELYLAMTLNHSGGLLLRWYRDEFCKLELEQSIELGVDAYELILSGITNDPAQIMVLPHFTGSGTPRFDTRSKGAILGLTANTTKKDIAKAVLEGITYELKQNLEVLKKGAVKIDELRAIGGGARSPYWLQLKSDITGIPVLVPAVTEAAGLGAAILAGVGAGVYANAPEAIEGILEIKDRIEPNVERVQKFKHRFEIFREIYPTIRELSYRL
jgi:xylulokinase